MAITKDSKISELPADFQERVVKGELKWWETLLAGGGIGVIVWILGPSVFGIVESTVGRIFNRQPAQPPVGAPPPVPGVQQ